jgi:hypothetical protein
LSGIDLELMISSRDFLPVDELHWYSYVKNSDIVGHSSRFFVFFSAERSKKTEFAERVIAFLRRQWTGEMNQDVDDKRVMMFEWSTSRSGH